MRRCADKERGREREERKRYLARAAGREGAAAAHQQVEHARGDEVLVAPVRRLPREHDVVEAVDGRALGAQRVEGVAAGEGRRGRRGRRDKRGGQALERENGGETMRERRGTEIKSMNGMNAEKG